MGDKNWKIFFKCHFSPFSLENGRTYNSIVTLGKVQKTIKKYYCRCTNFFENKLTLEINFFIYLFQLINTLEIVGIWELKGGIYWNVSHGWC